MRISHTSQPTFILLIALLVINNAYADFDVQLPISSTGGGSYSVEAGFGSSTPVDFLIDTGAGMSTVSDKHFSALKRTHDVSLVRTIAARLANGKLQKARVYRFENFNIAGQCNIGSVEMAVLPNSGRNIIGMDVLAKTAPFGLHLDKPTLAVSNCQKTSGIADLELSMIE